MFPSAVAVGAILLLRERKAFPQHPVAQYHAERRPFTTSASGSIQLPERSIHDKRVDTKRVSEDYIGGGSRWIGRVEHV